MEEKCAKKCDHEKIDIEKPTTRFCDNFNKDHVSKNYIKGFFNPNINIDCVPEVDEKKLANKLNTLEKNAVRNTQHKKYYDTIETFEKTRKEVEDFY